MTYNPTFRGPILAGSLVLVLGLGGFGAWAVTAPLATGVIAPATLGVESSRKTIQHLEGGIVKEILARDGDRVTAGQPLLRLDETQIAAQRQLLRGRLDAALAQQARLSAERGGRDAVTFPETLLARAGDTAVADAINGQRELFRARSEARTSRADVLANRIAQSATQVEALERRIGGIDRQLTLVAEELGGKRKLAKKGYTSGNQVRAVERELARLQGERGETLAEIAQARQAMNEARLQIPGQETEFREGVEAELRETETTIFDLSERLAATEAQFARLVVTAPVAGEVVDMAAHTVGGVIAPGSRILDVVPQADALIVEAQVSPADIDDVRTGMPATIRFSGFNRGIVPQAEGKVVTVSADRLTDPRHGTVFFKVRVTVDPDKAGTLAGLDLLPGMPAEVLINKGERTLYDYFAVPLRELVTHALRA